MRAVRGSGPRWLLARRSLQVLLLGGAAFTVGYGLVVAGAVLAECGLFGDCDHLGRGVVPLVLGVLLVVAGLLCVPASLALACAALYARIKGSGTAS